MYLLYHFDWLGNYAVVMHLCKTVDWLPYTTINFLGQRKKEKKFSLKILKGPFLGAFNWIFSSLDNLAYAYLFLFVYAI